MMLDNSEGTRSRPEIPGRYSPSSSYMELSDAGVGVSAANEAMMLLYCSLHGEAGEELGWCDVKLTNRPEGVQYIIDTLRQPLMTRAVYIRQRCLHEYEYVQRGSTEAVHSFEKRFFYHLGDDNRYLTAASSFMLTAL